MTPSQTKLYWRLWGAACKAQAWHTQTAAVRDQLRRDCHQAAGVPTSSKDINSTDHFDAIKAHLQMLAGNLKATVETDHPDHGAARRLLNKIQNYQLPLLRALLSLSPGERVGVRDKLVPATQSPTSQGDAVANYLAPILKQKYHLSRGLEDIDTLSAQPRFGIRHGRTFERPSQLEQLIMDLARTIQSKRKSRAWTVHDLHQRAHLPCPFNCTQCAMAQLNHAPLAHAHAGPQHDDNPF